MISWSFFTNLMNVFPMLVLTFWQKAGLNHIILGVLFLLFAVVVLVYVIVVLYPLSCNTVSHNGFGFPYSSSLQDKSDNLLFIILGRSLRIVDGWSNFALI